MSREKSSSTENLQIRLERDLFLRSLIRELAGTLHDVVGLDEAAGFISIVGQRIGDQINRDYKTALQVDNLNRSQVCEVLDDLVSLPRVGLSPAR